MTMSNELEPEVMSERFPGSIIKAMGTIRKVKGFRKGKKLYVQAFLRSGEAFYTSKAAAWVDTQTEEGMVLFINESKSIIVSLSNIDRIELLYEKPKDEKISGFSVEKYQESKHGHGK